MALALVERVATDLIGDSEHVRHADSMFIGDRNPSLPSCLGRCTSLDLYIFALFATSAGFLMLTWRTPLSKCASTSPSAGLKGKDIER